MPTLINEIRSILSADLTEQELIDLILLVLLRNGTLTDFLIDVAGVLDQESLNQTADWQKEELQDVASYIIHLASRV